MGLDLTAVMTLSYLALGSAVTGYISVWSAEVKRPRPIWQWILLPWLSILLVLVGASLFLLEGVICLVFALPLLMLFASIGGVIAGVLRRKARPGIKAQLFIVVLPLILPQIEMSFPAALLLPRSGRT